jgi:hypothetical protein
MNKNNYNNQIITKIALRCVSLLACFSFLVMIFGSVSVKAQDTSTNNGGIISFRACTPEISSGAGSNSKGAEVLIKCVQQVSIILLIFGIIIGGIMTARDTLQGYIPGQEVNSAQNLRDRIRNLITGVILISLPGAILALFNPAATGLDFLSGLEGIRNASGIGGNSGGGNGTNGGGGTSGGAGGSDGTNTSGGNSGGGNGTNGGGGTSGGAGGSGSGSSWGATSSGSNLTTLKVIKETSKPSPVSSTSTGTNSCRDMYFTGQLNQASTPLLYSFQACADRNLANYYTRFNDCLKATASGPNLLQFEMIPGSSCKLDSTVKNIS